MISLQQLRDRSSLRDQFVCYIELLSLLFIYDAYNSVINSFLDDDVSPIDPWVSLNCSREK